MKRFVVKSVCFLFPLLLLFAGIEWHMRSIPNSYRQKDNWMQHHAEEVEVLVLGNSHGLFGIRPDMFSKRAYNLCNVSQTFEYDEYLLRRFLPKCTRLRDVILIVDNSNLFDGPLELSEPFRCTYYRLYMDYPKHSLLSKYGFELASISALKKKLTARDAALDSLGWNTSYSKEQREASSVTEHSAMLAVQHHTCKDWTYATDNFRHLQKIASMCQANGIRLILLQAPVIASYYQRISQRQKDFVRYCCTHTPGAVSKDYSQCRDFVSDDFFDTDHLDDEGAAKWSQMIDNDFLKF